MISIAQCANELGINSTTFFNTLTQDKDIRIRITQRKKVKDTDSDGKSVPLLSTEPNAGMTEKVVSFVPFDRSRHMNRRFNKFFITPEKFEEIKLRLR